MRTTEVSLIRLLEEFSFASWNEFFLRLANATFSQDIEAKDWSDDLRRKVQQYGWKFQVCLLAFYRSIIDSAPKNLRRCAHSAPNAFPEGVFRTATHIL
jgi:hypothetical protein